MNIRKTKAQTNTVYSVERIMESKQEYFHKPVLINITGLVGFNTCNHEDKKLLKILELNEFFTHENCSQFSNQNNNFIERVFQLGQSI